MTTKRPWVIHPFLLAALPTLYLYSRNLQTVDGSEVIWPVGISVVVSVVAYSVLRLLRLDGPRAGLLTSTFLVLFFSFSHGIRLSERWGLGPDRATREGVILAIEGVVLAVVATVMVRHPGFARTVNDACNGSAGALALMTLGAIVFPGSRRDATRAPRLDEPVAADPFPSARRLPDVYLVILDAYGRSDVLKERIGFDNSGFVERLERKGFVVPRSSRANYCQTALSLAATLNLRYLDELAGDPSEDRRPLRRLIAENRVFRSFRQRGYRLVTFASGFDATESFSADLNLAPPGNLRTFHALIADQTPLWLLTGQRASREPHRLHRERTLKVFDELPAVDHPSDGPTFTFAHVLSPHPPFIFDADGHDLSARESLYSMNDSEGWRDLPGHQGSADYANRYREQVAYVTRRIEQAVDRILATSPVAPVIIIQGDHGPGSDFESAADQPNDLCERFGILNACYLPEPARSKIDDQITPINTLRAVLDECLGSNLGPLENRSYYSSYTKPYLFVEVTDELD